MADSTAEQRNTAVPLPSVSPIFDVPEFPSLRRMIPLPKRRRTIDTTPLNRSSEGAPVAQAQDRSNKSQTTPDELASTLSTTMALSNSYYVPLFNGSGDLQRDDTDTRHVSPGDVLTRTNSRTNGYTTNEGREEGDREDGGYADHLSQPGNTASSAPV